MEDFEMSSNFANVVPVSGETMARSNQLHYTSITEGQLNEFEVLHQKQIQTVAKWMLGPCDFLTAKSLIAGENELFFQLQGIRTYTFPCSVDRMEEALWTFHCGMLIRLQLILAKVSQSLSPDLYESLLQEAHSNFPGLKILELSDTDSKTSHTLNGQVLNESVLGSLVQQFILLQEDLEQDYRETLSKTGICLNRSTNIQDLPSKYAHSPIAQELLSSFALRAEASSLVFDLNATGRSSFELASQRFRDMQARMAQNRQDQASQESWTSRIWRFFKFF